MVQPFERLSPAVEVGGAEWALSRMRDRDGVALVAPDCVEAVVRVLHPLADGVLWADVAPEYLDPTGPLPPMETIPYDHQPNESASADALVPHLRAATSTPTACHYGVWSGYGTWHPGASSMFVWSTDPAIASPIAHDHDPRQQSVWNFVASCPVVPWWGGRDMFLVDGSIEAVAAIGGPGGFPLDGSDVGDVSREPVCWWWPEDRAWFVGYEIDFRWSYVAGPRSLVEAIEAMPQLETIRTGFGVQW